MQHQYRAAGSLSVQPAERILLVVERDGLAEALLCASADTTQRNAANTAPKRARLVFIRWNGRMSVKSVP